MKNSILLITVLLLLSGCAHHQFHNFSKQKYTRLSAQKPKEESVQQAEKQLTKSDPIAITPQVTIPEMVQSSISTTEETATLSPQQQTEKTSAIPTITIKRKPIKNRPVKATLVLTASVDEPIKTAEEEKFDRFFIWSLLTLVLAFGVGALAFFGIGYVGIVLFTVIAFVSWLFSLKAFILLKKIPKARKEGVAFALKEVFVTLYTFLGWAVWGIGLLYGIVLWTL